MGTNQNQFYRMKNIFTTDLAYKTMTIASFFRLIIWLHDVTHRWAFKIPEQHSGDFFFQIFPWFNSFDCKLN